MLSQIQCSLLCLFTIAFTTINAQSVNFTDCGPGNIKDVRIYPCPSEPCLLNLNTTVTVEADFIGHVKAEKVSEVIKGVIRGREIPFPEQRQDPCASGNIQPSCPIVKDKKYVYKATFDIKPFYPPIPVKVKYALTNMAGQTVACVQIGAKIIDPNPKPQRSRNSRPKNQRNRKQQTSN